MPTSGHTTAQRNAMQASYTAYGTALGSVPAGMTQLTALYNTERRDLQTVVTKEGGAPLS